METQKIANYRRIYNLCTHYYVYGHQSIKHVILDCPITKITDLFQSDKLCAISDFLYPKKRKEKKKPIWFQFHTPDYCIDKNRCMIKACIEEELPNYRKGLVPYTWIYHQEHPWIEPVSPPFLNLGPSQLLVWKEHLTQKRSLVWKCPSCDLIDQMHRNIYQRIENNRHTHTTERISTIILFSKHSA